MRFLRRLRARGSGGGYGCVIHFDELEAPVVRQHASAAGGEVLRCLRAADAQFGWGRLGGMKSAEQENDEERNEEHRTGGTNR